MPRKLQWFAGHASRSPEGRGGERRVSAALPLLDDVTYRLRRGACPALAPKCQLILARTLRTEPGLSKRVPLIPSG